MRDKDEATGLRDAAKAASLRDEAISRDTAGATDRPDSPPATAAELEGFYRHLESALWAADFLREGRSKQIRLRLRRIFQRSGLNRNEVNILRGVLTALAGGKRDGRREPTRQQAGSVE